MVVPIKLALHVAQHMIEMHLTLRRKNDSHSDKRKAINDNKYTCDLNPVTSLYRIIVSMAAA